MKQNCKINPNVASEVEFLKKIASTKNKKDLRKILNDSSLEQLRIICEIASNICRGTFRISENRKNLLRPHAKRLRQLSKADNHSVARKVLQKGGAFPYLPLLIAPVVDVLIKQFLKQ